MAKAGLLAALLVLLLLAAGCTGRLGGHAASSSAPTTSDGTSSDQAGVTPVAPPPKIAQALAFPTGHPAGEPSLSVDVLGHVFVTSIEPSTSAGGGIQTGVLRSDDGGKTWQNVSPRMAGQDSQPSTSDPFFYQDPTTGRLFVLDQQGVSCNLLSTSADFGASWNPPEPVCPTPVTDHPSLVAAAPMVLPAIPLYPNTVYVCESTVVSVACNESNDGGITFRDIGAPYPVPDDCSGIAGKLAAAPDGTLYLPKNECSTITIASTFDDGTTWTVNSLKDFHPIDNAPDPALAVDANGVLYMATVDNGGRIALLSSADHGATWSKPIDVMPSTIVAGNLPAIAAGAGHVAIAYYGTRTPGGFSDPEAAWDGYISILDTTHLQGSAPTARVNPAADPLVRGVCGPGRCGNVLDFISVQLDLKGRAWGAFVDTCPAECMAPADSTGRDGVVGMWDGKP